MSVLLKAQPRRHGNAIAGFQLFGEDAQHLGTRHDITAVQCLGPQRAGVIDGNIDAAGRQALEGNARAEAGPHVRGLAGGAQIGRNQFGQYILLGKRLGADQHWPDLCGRAALQPPAGDARRQQAEEDKALGGRRPAPFGNAALAPTERAINDQRQRGGRHAAEQHLLPILDQERGDLCRKLLGLEALVQQPPTTRLREEERELLSSARWRKKLKGECGVIVRGERGAAACEGAACEGGRPWRGCTRTCSRRGVALAISREPSGG